MEIYKKYGRSAFAKHLRKTKGKWTKAMANGKSRSKSKLDLKIEEGVDAQLTTETQLGSY
jgi:hypothetical protein